ncbi:MAG: PAS domain S-box protein [Methylococcaceae bacterium]|nr:PAS domain S-box protein [Methylococcaceae bacterium]MDD1615805.1 PAS domain S-box protein [Methylococcaceae bacterium]OYV19407.1 MAG: PAS/PAC sensor-containing diguanylate cyclase/phosphodiesterase [Methylococcaceae bacterium NSP1-2]
MIIKSTGYRVLLFNLALTVVYFLLAKLGLLFATNAGNVTLVWLPSGLALAVFLLGGARYMPGIFFGAFAAGIAVGDSEGVSAGIALGNTLEPLLGWWLLTRWVKFDITLTKLRDFLLILFFAAPLSACISAVIGITVLVTGGLLTMEQWSSSVLTWWMADVLGIILVTPLIIVWRTLLPNLQNYSLQQILNTVLLFTLTFLAGQIIFLGWFANSFGSVANAVYLMFLFISWAAINSGVRGVTLVLIITAVQALLGVHQGVGYFNNGLIGTHLTNFWLYILSLSVVGMTLATYIIECKQNSSALQESETRFRNLLEEIPSVAVQGYGKNGILNYWNKASEHLYGYSKSEAIGQDIVELLLPVDMYESYRQAIQQMFETTQAIPITELSLLNKNGSKVDIFAYHAYVHAPGHEPEVFCIDIDMTDYKHMEEKLRASESRLRSIIDISPVPMALSDKHHNITFLNPAFEHIFGYNTNDLHTIDDWWLKTCPDLTYRQAAQSVWQAALEKASLHRKAIAPIEFNATCKSGKIKTILVSAAAIEKTFNSIYLVVFYDITEHKKNSETVIRNEALLRRKDGYQRALLDNFPFRVWFKDTNSRFLAVNQAFAKALGVDDPEQLVGKSDFDFYEPDLAEHHYQDDLAVLSSRQKQTAEEEYIDHFGLHSWIETYKAPVIDINGEILGTVGFARDITERKNNETDLRIAATAFESQDGMFVTDANQIILRINRAFTAITGYTAEDVIGQTPMIFNSYHQDDSFYAELWDCIFDVGAWQGEIWTQRKNGDLYLAWLMVTPVKDKQGNITHYVTALTDITVRKEAEEQIKQFAFYDSLTRLPNRRKLLERLDHCIAAGMREKSQFAVLMLDLDRFKAVNDNFGHLAGDELLQHVAERISKRLRSTDMVARLGGDEFVVLLNDISHKEDAARVADMIVADLTNPFHLSQHDNVQIGTSIGISLYPEHGDSSEMLMDNADVALYQAKNNGRGCFAYFSESLTLATRQRLQLETKLRRGIEEQELRVFYQPAYDIATGKIIGAEALVRWQDLDELMPPSYFIPIAEETSLIIDIGAWVLYETCQQGKEWLDAGLPPITLSVNVSAPQIKRSNMVTLVSAVLTETDFPAEQLELEITEQGLMENNGSEFIVDILNSLHALGIRLAIDNFGTGYSSLAHLKSFPLDILKIDKSFINTISPHHDNMAIASTIIAMGHSLGFKVLAEGVETEEQLAFLSEKGCDFYQGYIKSKPLPAEEFTALLREQMTK